MKSILKPTFTILAAVLASTGAGATTGVAADATVSNFSITLVDLDLADGITPSVTFTQGDTVADSQAHVDDNTDHWNEQVASHLFGPVVSTTTYGPGTSATSSFSGDPFAGGATLASSATAANGGTGQPGLMAESLIYLGKITQATFVLSPNTVMMVGGTATAHASAEQLYGDAYAVGSFFFQLATLPNSVDQQSSTYFNYAQANYGTPEGALQDVFGLSFVNATQGSLDGILSADVLAFGRSGQSLTVPEPGARAMLLAGLGLLGAAARRGRPA